MQRFLSVDLLRGMAILLMVQVHFISNLSSSEPPSAWLYETSGWLGVLPAPLFCFVSGLSFALWVRKQQRSWQKDEAITVVAIRRGLFLFGAGLALNVFVWLPDEIFNWDILTFLGASFVVLAYARKCPPEILGLLCVVVLLLSPPLRVLSDYAEYWDNENYLPDFTLTDVVLGFFVNGYFPLLPWIIFPLTGFIVGDFGAGTGRSLGWLRWLAAIGSAFIALSVLGVLFGAKIPSVIAKHYLKGLTLYPASTEYLFGSLGVCMLSFAILHRWIDCGDRNTFTGYVPRFLQLWSSFSLTIYFVHLCAHIWPLWIYGVWMGEEDPTAYWRKAMTPPAAAGLALAFVVLCTPALVLLERHRKYSFEAVMRKICDS